ncbi:MAG: nucleotidyltransferase domain-containing protein [Cyanobacteria bacterium J06631_9]
MATAVAIEEVLTQRLKVTLADVATLCQQFDIVELCIFGSVLREDFRAHGENQSDVDVLVVFGEKHSSSWETWLDLQSALCNLFRRKVDVVHKRLLKNPYRRAEILNTMLVVYEQG